jgi:hypothetical protein
MNKKQPSELMPSLEDITENERAWVGFLRLITQDTDPAPTLAGVQALRCVFSDCRPYREAPD